jgi:hypothetical protein
MSRKGDGWDNALDEIYQERLAAAPFWTKRFTISRASRPRSGCGKPVEKRLVEAASAAVLFGFYRSALLQGTRLVPGRARLGPSMP